MNKIHIIDSTNEKHTISYRQFEYPNLMELMVDNLYDDIGECLGRGLCGTCHVIVDNEILENDMDLQEHDTLSKLNNRTENSRLACQIILNEKINSQTFKIITEDHIKL